MTSALRRFVPVPRRRQRFAVALALLAFVPLASAVGIPSTYAGCANRSVTVAAGGSVTVDLRTCHSFGLGRVSVAPARGSAVASGGEPVNAYVYTHDAAAGAGSDRFVVLDDNSDTITIDVTIAAASTGVTIAADLPPLAAGTAAGHALTATGGRAPYRFRVSEGQLPTGLALGTDGRLTGTPTRRDPFTFTVQATDAAGATATQAFAGQVQAASMALRPATATAKPGVPFTLALRVDGGVPPHRFVLQPGGVLPNGIVLSGEGRLGGTTPALPGHYPVSIQVTDASPGTGEHFQVLPFTLSVGGPPTVGIAVAPAAVVEDAGTPLVFTVTLSEAQSSDTAVVLSRAGGVRFAAGPADAPTRVVIPAGTLRAYVRVTPHADGTVEPDETLAFTVAPGDGYVVGQPASATGTIRNDD